MMYSCSKCKQLQWSVQDRKYLELYGHCWSCDKKEWEAGRLPFKEFEKREVESLK